MKNLKYLIMIAAMFTLITGSASAGMSASASADPNTAALIRRLEDLEQEVALLKRQLSERQTEENLRAAGSKPPAASPTADPAIVTLDPGKGFTVQSADGSFRTRVGGYLQGDGRFFTDNDKSVRASGTTDTFAARRVRLLIEGTFHEFFDYKIMPSFDRGTAGLQDAYLDYRYAPEIRFRAGRFKSPFGLERLKSSAATTFVEKAYPTGLTPDYDTGLQVSGDLNGGAVHYAAALVNGAADGAALDTDTNNDQEFAARLMLSPFKSSEHGFWRGLSAGAAVTHGHKEGEGVLPTLRSPGQAAIFSYASGVYADGAHTRFSPQASWYAGPFGVLGEYVVSSQQLNRGTAGDTFSNRAWQIAGSYVITGEAAGPKGVTPLRNFDPSAGGWGAWELAGRYHALDVDDAIFEDHANGVFANAASAVSGASSWTIGANWYLNQNLKLQFNFEHTEFEGGAQESGILADRPDETAVLSRFQIVY